ncbi:PucR family transcriptional regulator [Bacillus sp. J33]|uniref:PucR family transcriptional regulator n=1 Tax=Bacillus sp. J33 TaxID=935836 RepID=UPI00047B097C|nr:helix-turn-helix domain-containing protein [Bacillus sp. J33]
MFKKLHDKYPGSILMEEKPVFQNFSNAYWFYDHKTGEWLGIPSKDLSEDALMVLKTLFELHDASPHLHPAAQTWFDFLYANGNIPKAARNAPYRLIQFQTAEGDWLREDMETAFKGFFEKDIIILWNNPSMGVIIEEFTEPLTEEDFRAISNALESDFFVKTAFYIGTPNTLGDDFPIQFKEEKHFFEQAYSLLPSERVFSFEKTLPSLMTASLDTFLKRSLLSRLSLLKEDPELLNTIKVFLQHSSNVSLTAKKLYIHRNTLQYRLDKFTEKTGIQLKDFNSAVTVYLACLLYEQL